MRGLWSLAEVPPLSRFVAAATTAPAIGVKTCSDAAASHSLPTTPSQEVARGSSDQVDVQADSPQFRLRWRDRRNGYDAGTHQRHARRDKWTNGRHDAPLYDIPAPMTARITHRRQQ